jgi:hypothetical protein
MMFVGPVRPTDFFSADSKVSLRGQWSNWAERPNKRNSLHGSNKLLGAAMLGYTPEHFFSSCHVIYPLLRPAMEELFEKFQPAFRANAEYRFRSRKQFWPISAHDHLLLKSDRAQVAAPSDSLHLSKRFTLAASPGDLEARLRQLTEKTVRMACINYLEGVLDKVPDARRYLGQATGPAAPFEQPSRDPGRRARSTAAPPEGADADRLSTQGTG